jgi:hypothetical protein
MQFIMDNANVGVSTAPDGTRILSVMDNKSGITVVVPLPTESAKIIGQQLFSTIEIATPITDIKNLR